MVHIAVDRERIASFCRKWGIQELSFFGSVLRDDFRPDSDVDVLVVYGEHADLSLRAYLQAAEELKQLLGREVDLVERRAVEQSENYIRRKHVLRTAEVLYVA
jgi:predicted nucleotidyltransferase